MPTHKKIEIAYESVSEADADPKQLLEAQSKLVQEIASLIGRADDGGQFDKLLFGKIVAADPALGDPARPGDVNLPVAKAEIDPARGK